MLIDAHRLHADHSETILDLPDEYLRDIGPLLKKVARVAPGAQNFNVLQVNFFLCI